MKRILKVIVIFMFAMLVGCHANDKSYLKLDNVDYQNGYCYSFELNNIQSMQIMLDVYEVGVKTDTNYTLPLGSIHYNKQTSDQGKFVLEYVLSDSGNRVIKLKSDSEIFNHYGDTKILNSNINLNHYTPQLQTDSITIDNQSKIINLIDCIKETDTSHNQNELQNGYKITLEVKIH